MPRPTSPALRLALLLAAPAEAFASCPADLDASGTVDAADLGAVLVAWGASGKSAGSADLNDDNLVDAADLGLLLAAWGACGVTVPNWATLLEAAPDASIVTNPDLRAAIAQSGYAWRVRDAQTGMEMVLVPAGGFTMGCPDDAPVACYPDERPAHDVTLSFPFYMARHEVTQAQWVAMMGSNPSFFQPPSYPGPAERPVEWVSWSDIQAFLSLTGMRLPTEAQWEYAYRAGTVTMYHGVPGQPEGSDNPAMLDSIAWWAGNHGAPGTPAYGTKAVGLKLANGFGLFDMSGNVWEWVRDWHAESYDATSPAIDPQGPVSGTRRVLRGGGCGYNADSCRSSVRGEVTPGFRHGMIGFRTVRELVD
jgi:formylglycine-generating enzyme required for sulfatase activity